MLVLILFLQILSFGIGYLSSSHGQEIQERAYRRNSSIFIPMVMHGRNVLIEERVPYVTALYKEILRYYTVIPILSSLDEVLNDIQYNDAIIPAGTLFYMNAICW